MGFRENLLKKIQIDQLSDTVRRSMGPADSSRRIDQEAMRRLLELGPYRYQRERDLDLYILNPNEILALDNELKIYRTTAADIALRKSPTVKEMVSIRNAIKILNDKNVVVSRKAETLQRVQQDLVKALDLSFTAADIASLASEGSQALENGYAEGVAEVLTLFADLLGYSKAPKIFQIPHHQIWGALQQAGTGGQLFGPLVMFSLMNNSLKMILKPINSLDQDALNFLQQAARGGTLADLTEGKVWEALKEAVLNRKA
jgi:hypothetical protein